MELNSAKPEMQDHEAEEKAILDQVCHECMVAIDTKNKESFKEQFEYLVANILHKVTEPEGLEGEQSC